MKKKIILNNNINIKTLKDGFIKFKQFCRVKNISNFMKDSLICLHKYFPTANLIKDINKNTIDDYILWLKINSYSKYAKYVKINYIIKLINSDL